MFNWCLMVLSLVVSDDLWVIEFVKSGRFRQVLKDLMWFGGVLVGEK